MLNLGLGEILVIAALILVVVGPDRLPFFMRWAGRQYGTLRRAADDMRRAFVLEADRQDADARYRELQERRRKAAGGRKKKGADDDDGADDASADDEPVEAAADD